MQKLDELLSSVSFEKAGPVNAVDIQFHEKNLKLEFGPSYRMFLSKYGCVSVGPNEIYGVCGANKSVPSAIHATLSARRDPAFPPNLLVIGDDGSGRKFCVDSQDDIFVCDRGVCQRSGKSFEDFAIEWLGI
jgi:hypothetical protein